MSARSSSSLSAAGTPNSPPGLYGFDEDTVHIDVVDAESVREKLMARILVNSER
jgi:hypothetical protein